MKDLLQKITIYHKENNEWVRYNIEASVRNVSYRNRSKTGVTTSDNALIRIFDIDGYNTTWKCMKGDVIVAIDTTQEIISAPLTELRTTFGKENVFEVQSAELFIFNDEDLKELNHIKIGGK